MFYIGILLIYLYFAIHLKYYNPQQTILLTKSKTKIIRKSANHLAKKIFFLIVIMILIELKGLEKAELEFGLMALGHNTRKKIVS
ncbi:MAG: hypothetical protein CVU03_12670 [Bacteroidetes bacterium HGW-Bacteroidetes-2]|jgi:hypothetical protein|nr:MAG: hypothetical protein CVU03_12670 [Bacteroidetes bacterium HGW-Bacteroidetes-2]